MVSIRTDEVLGLWALHSISAPSRDLKISVALYIDQRYPLLYPNTPYSQYLNMGHAGPLMLKQTRFFAHWGVRQYSRAGLEARRHKRVDPYICNGPPRRNSWLAAQHGLADSTRRLTYLYLHDPSRPPRDC